MDGVIADTNHFHKISIQQFAQRYGVKTDEAYLRKEVYGRINAEWIPAMLGEMRTAEMETYAAEKEALFREMYAPHLEEVAGLTAFLRQLQASGIQAAVATSAPPENMDFILDGLGIRAYFQAFLNSNFVTHGKPHPEIYLKAMDALGLAAQDCIVIEDSLSGVEAGINAGCKVIGVLTTHTADELHRAHLTIANFEGFGLNQLQQLTAI